MSFLACFTVLSKVKFRGTENERNEESVAFHHVIERENVFTPENEYFPRCGP